MKTNSRKLPTRLFGVTIDNVRCVSSIVEALKEMKRGAPTARPIVRIVFDFDEAVFNDKKIRFEEKDFYPEVLRYKKAIDAISKEAFVMGEIVDSSAVYRCHYDSDESRSYVERTKAYVRKLGNVVNIWEIGNEINGEWVGWRNNKSEWEDPNVTIEQLAAVRRRVAKEIKLSFDALKSIDPNALTALTFYYNDDGVHYGWTDDKKGVDGKPAAYGRNYSMTEWAKEQKAFLPDVDYVLLSYYEDDNDEVLPNRKKMDVTGLVNRLKQLAGFFPAKTQFGFGEFAPQCHACEDRRCAGCLSDQVEFINRYYIDLDLKVRNALSRKRGWNRNYIGGYFYWYYKQDVVNQENPKTIDAFQKAFTRFNK